MTRSPLTPELSRAAYCLLVCVAGLLLGVGSVLGATKSPAGHASLGDTVLPRAVPPAGRRAWMARQSALCLGAIAEASGRYGLPAGLLAAVARVETGRPLPVTGDRQPWPWSVNADGESLFFDTRTSAAEETTRRLATGARYVDIGCTQIDLRMHPRAFASLAEAFNPALNADYAARMLAGLHDAGHAWPVAAGLYHSATPGLLEPYQARVAAMRRVQRPLTERP